MLEATHELWKTVETTSLSGVLVQGSHILGEIDGRLFTLREEEEYAQRGGARYAGNISLTNRQVLSAESSFANAQNERSGTSSRNSSSLDGSTGASRSEVRPSHSFVPPPASSPPSNFCEGEEDRYPRGRDFRRLLSRLFLTGHWKVREVANNTLRVTASLLPLIRLVYPSAVPRSVAQSSLLVGSSSSANVGHTMSSRFGNHSPEQVIAMCFHPCRPLLAVVVDEGGSGRHARVLIADIVNSSASGPLSLSHVLTHAFQKGVEAVAWKPFSDDVLAVGCESGVLLWSLEAGEGTNFFTGDDGGGKRLHPRLEKYALEKPWEECYPTFRSSPSLSSSKPSSSPHLSRNACCVFYPFCGVGVSVTSLAFSNQTGRFLACGSRFYCAFSLVDVTVPPCDEHSSIKWTPSLDGGMESVEFAPRTDAFLLSLTCGHASVNVTSLSLPENWDNDSNPSSASMRVIHSSKRIATPFPVLAAKPATGVASGEDIYYYFLQLAGVEGLVLARLDVLQSALHVISLISMKVQRGIGGLVRTFACSKHRLWIATETGHLVVLYYRRQHYWTERGGYIGVGRVDPGCLSVIPIGAAVMDVSCLAAFQGFPAGSLAAVVEQGHLLHLLPSYHS